MDHFALRSGELHAEEIPLRALAARYGTPLYVYSKATLRRHLAAFDEGFTGQPHLVCYAVKANSNLSVLRTLAQGGAGFDIVSGGELFRALKAGGDPAKIVYSGVGKTDEELDYAIRSRILLFNVESDGELERIEAAAKRRKRRARISIRVNPDVDPKTHPYIATGLASSKFGVPMARARAMYAQAAKLPNLEIAGVDCHIGSQLTQVQPFLDALDRVTVLVRELRARGHSIRYLDIGGGLGITYSDEAPPHPRDYGTQLRSRLEGLDVTLILEPGRVIVGNAGVLVTKVLYVKRGAKKRFVVVDAGMNDLIRPSFYDAFHSIEPVRPVKGRGSRKVDVVGPVCESGDFLAKDRTLAEVEPGELLCVRSAGAYGFAMSSNYNSRPRAAELLVDGAKVTLARRRETLADLVRGER